MKTCPVRSSDPVVAAVGPRALALLLGRRLAARRSLGVAIWGGLTVLVVWSAILAKTSHRAVALADVRLEPVNSELVRTNRSEAPAGAPTAAPTATAPTPASAFIGPMPLDAAPQIAATSAPAQDTIQDLSVRWFDGRAVRRARDVWMTVTAYSPDARSCGDSADGITATLHHVSTNGFKLVAADPRVLPYGSMISIPGYDTNPDGGGSEIVPVLDCGGAIKGYRLDVIFPTHEQARAWGVRKLQVTVWEFVDGSPRVNPRRAR